MMRTVPTLALFALAVSCSKEPESASPTNAPKLLVIKVEGMQRGEGGKT